MRHVPVLAPAIAIVIFCSSVQPALGQAPVNDDAAQAVVIGTLPFGDSIDTTLATTAASDPDCVGQGPTVWYAFTPIGDVRVEANTFGSSYDTTLSAYVVNEGVLEQLACNDDTRGLQSRIRLDMAAGRTYLLMIGAFGGSSGGSLILSVDVAPPPPPPLVLTLSIDGARLRPASGEATVNGTVTCSSPAWVSIFGEVIQKHGGQNIGGFFGTFLWCEGVTAWTASVEPQFRRFRGRAAALFVPGSATVSASAFGQDPENELFAETFASASIRIRAR